MRSFDRSTDRGICFQHAKQAGTCPYKDKCKYVHLDESNPADKLRLYDHFKSLAQEMDKRNASPGLHVLAEDFEPVASARSSEEFDNVDKED